MKVINPNHVTANAKIEEHRAAVLAFIARQSGALIDFEDIRKSFPAAKRGDLTDGLIHQICLDAGMKVDR